MQTIPLPTDSRQFVASDTGRCAWTVGHRGHRQHWPLVGYYVDGQGAVAAVLVAHTGAVLAVTELEALAEITESAEHPPSLAALDAAHARAAEPVIAAAWQQWHHQNGAGACGWAVGGSETPAAAAEAARLAALVRRPVTEARCPHGEGVELLGVAAVA